MRRSIPRETRMIVTSVDALNPFVQRISTDDAQFDIPTGAIEFSSGDAVRLDVVRGDVTSDSNAQCVMNGLVYHRDASRACISCGGLLLSVNNSSIPVDTTVQVHISKSRRRRRLAQNDD